MCVQNLPLKNITLRPAEKGDLSFFFDLYSDSRQLEVSGFGWAPEQMKAFLQMQFTARESAYRMQYPSLQYLLILNSGERAGRLIIDRSDHQTVIVDIAITSDYRKQGIGSRVIRKLQEEASDARGCVVLRVDKNNTGAIRLYESLGFTISNESQIFYSMIWKQSLSEGQEQNPPTL